MRICEERLDREKYFVTVGEFKSGADEPLDMFLSDYSFKYDEEQYGKTYILTSEESDTILAFYTIKANGIQVSDSNNAGYDSMPVVEIARIAVDYSLQDKGLGKRMFCDYIMPKVQSVKEIIAVKAIIVFVEPNNIKGIRFYKSLGFVKADEVVQNTIGESFNEKCDLYVLSL